MEMYWASEHIRLVENSPCHPASQRDLNQTMSASQWIVASYSLLFYVVLFVLGAVSVCSQTCVKICSSQAMLIVFLIGAMMDLVHMFTNSHKLELKIYFRLTACILIGIVFVVFGAVLFFSKAEGVDNQQHTLQKQQPSMGFVVAAITIPLIIVEFFLLAATWASKKLNDSFELSNPWSLIVSDKLVFLLQKIIQAITYCNVLRYKTFSARYIENAKFYFKILAFFNFIEWVDSQVNEDSDVQLSGENVVYEAWFDVFVTFYKALIIDYRLLCSLLFLEHALEDADGGAVNNEGVSTSTSTRSLNVQARKQRNFGLLVGFTSLSAPIFCALYYVPKLHMPAWVHAFSIAVNLAIIGFGVIFLKTGDFTSEERNSTTGLGLSGVKIMVSCLGAVGIICWLLKATIAGYWAVTAHERTDIDDPSYFAWVAPKFSIRGFTTAFLIYLFLKLETLVTPLRNRHVAFNHFLVPVLTLMILGTFLECLIDQYVGPLDSRLRCEIHDLSLRILFDAGPAMSLGFLIHVFLHFVIIASKITKQPDNDGQNNNIIQNYGSFPYQP
ncbi:uncharacterized protein [Montipora capricornis]|uniref:uncharacterized protein n=1 Tax=Montipora capricornis TaxID=246305 RepID=UPI0035F169D0